MEPQELIELKEITPEDLQDLLRGIRRTGSRPSGITPVVETPTQTPAAQAPEQFQNSIEQAIAQRTAAEWGEQEWPAMRALIMKESGFNPNAQNSKSTAYGLFQFLDSTWKGYGVPKTADPALQTEAGIRYIKKRYGSPSKALEHHNQRGWY